MTSTTTKTMKTSNRWGFFVIALYGGFVIFILACVGFASFQRFDLVDKQYYEKGITHQTRIDEMNRVGALAQPPALMYDRATRSLVVTFPATFPVSEISGQVKLFRPSNSSYDRTVSLLLSADGTQRVDMTNLPAGKWKAQMAWTFRGQSYYQEELIIAE